MADQSEDKLQKIKTLKKEIYKEIKDLSEEKAEALLKRFRLMCDVEKNDEVEQDAATKIFTPPLKKGQVVQAKFVGQGTALNGKHFALIWNVNPKEGQVVVLPMSSKIKRNQGMFNLGPISGLRSPVNLVLFQQSHVVPRESIHIWTRRGVDENGNQQDIPLELTEFQLKHMESLFRYTHLREKDLFYKICFETGNKIPLFIPDDLVPHINRHIKVDVDTEKVSYKLPHETKFKDFPLVDVSLNTRKRFQLLSGLFSSEKSKRIAANEEIQALTEV
ncbi:hypothetical protein [Domibacillus tundrae]|uniref:hypothetical protein n=1 Tax=Domibacillus tundrae TaxID=1587527 RepID=UPI000617DBF0|nr:hypothetical protein [Domibacillus tundrae]